MMNFGDAEITGANGTLNVTSSMTSSGSISLIGSNFFGGGANAILNVSGPSFTNSGTINLNGVNGGGNAELEISGSNVTLSGNGTVNLSNGANNIIMGAAPSDTLTTANTIQGAGTIENLGIVNTGTLLANQTTPLVILPSAAGLNNKGTLNVTSGSTMQVGTSSGGALVNFSGTTLTGGTYTVGGTLQFGSPGTTIVTNAANITLTGASSQIIDFASANILAPFATNAATGTFSISSGRNFTTAGNFTNNGTLSIGGGTKFAVNGNLTNFSAGTLTGGTYKITGALQFNGANIVTNAAKITLTGAGSKIIDQTGANALTNFATNAATGSLTLASGRNFTTAGNFTNSGSLVVGAGTNFTVNGNLTNFSGSKLTGGTYSVTGTLQFNGANIVTNAAKITLTGLSSRIINQSATNALTNFANNVAAGTFTLAGSQSLTTAGGSFTNAGKLTVSAGSTFTVGNGGNTAIAVNYTQTGGTTTVDGTLTSMSSTTTPTLTLSGGSLFGDGTLGYGVVDSAAITPGDSATKTGVLGVTGTYAQNTSGALDISIGGTQAKQFDQLNVTSSASLNGTLNISLVNGFVPTVGTQFDILNASSVGGTFATVNGTSINASEHFTITYNGNDVILTVVSGAAAPATFGTASEKQSRPSIYLGSLGRTLGRTMPVFVPRYNRPMAATSPVRNTAFSTPRFSQVQRAVITSVKAPAYRAMRPAVAAPLPQHAGARRRGMEFGLDLLSLVHAGPRQFMRNAWNQPGRLNYLAFGPAN